MAIFHDKDKPCELINLRVKKEEIIVAGLETKECTHIYRESLSAIVRGVPFSHHVSMDLAPIDAASCAAIIDNA